MDIEKCDEKQSELFYKIKIDIKNYPQKYREAEKWLKEYCSENAYRKRQRDELAKHRTREKILPKDAFKRRVKHFKRNIQEAPYSHRFKDAHTYLIERYEGQWQRSVLIEDARRILLFTWWLSNPDAELDFVKWPWHSQGRGISRRYAGLLWLNDKGWIELVRAAWTEVEIEQKIEQKDDDAYISYAKAIEFSNGILTRKKLNKAIEKDDPVKVRDKKPNKNRRLVHIQDILLLINKLSANEKAMEEAAKMFGEYQKQLQEKTNKQINLD